MYLFKGAVYEGTENGQKHVQHSFYLMKRCKNAAVSKVLMASWQQVVKDKTQMDAMLQPWEVLDLPFAECYSEQHNGEFWKLQL